MGYTPQKLSQVIAQQMDKYAQNWGRLNLQNIQSMNAALENIGNTCQDLLTENMRLTGENQRLNDQLNKLRKEHPELFETEKKPAGDKSEPEK